MAHLVSGEGGTLLQGPLFPEPVHYMAGHLVGLRIFPEK